MSSLEHIAAVSGTNDRPVSVVGAGNWLLTHDRIGPRVLELLQGRYGPEIELRDVGTSGLDLIDVLRGQELFIVVDACVRFGEPGSIHRVEPDLSEADTRVASVHQFGPVEALAVARVLYPERLPQKNLMLLVETGGIDEALQESACRELVTLVDQEIDTWRQGRGPQGAAEQGESQFSYGTRRET